MSITLENLPIIFMGIVVVGVAILIMSTMMIASLVEPPLDKIEHDDGPDDHYEELFSYFLKEEEKKNEAFRKDLLKESIIQQEPFQKNIKTQLMTKQQWEEKPEILAEVIKRYEQGESEKSIAKNLKKGIGEVRLMLSLYTENK